ncbi:lysophospholipase L2 [Psychromonas marina]|uniref:Lysophospholipase L2 n=1 Tax=Psychromonas marina TaxID=88364 RepID=A0ABQ6DXU5_9GAMM|nr:alpha/beta fold hydrolase [Psychromonas marina]GLS89566.1 lysophospholipase L2 [Psychromonas marina]
MKAKKYALLLTSLFLFHTTCSAANSDMINNPFNLNTESTLSNNYNADIDAFWQQYAQANTFQGIDEKNIHTIAITTGNDKAIVISQGRNESVLKYKEVAYDLNLKGYDLFLIDHRGQGLSERFGGDQYRGHVIHFQDYVDDLNQYVDSLALEKNYTQRYLVSHSMGGAISALYLEQYKTPFQGAIFFSPMLSINLGGLPPFIAKAVTYSSAEICSWFSDKACYVPAGEGYTKRPFEGNQLTHSEKRFYSSQYSFENIPATQLGDATMRWVATSISATEQAIKEANKINIPILLIQAGADEVVTSQGQKDFFDNIKNCKDSQFLTIDGAKHEILIESDKYRITALTHTLQFLISVAQGKRTCTK